VAHTAADLETASLAVLTRCNFQRDLEQTLIAENPRYRDFIHQRIQQSFRDMQNDVKGQIAVIRTRGQ
jgi:hypothetical protein